MRNCRKYCKHSPEIGDLILSNGLSYNVQEYKKLINPRAIINVRGSIKEEDAQPGDYLLDIGIYVPADVYEIVKDILPGEEIVDPMNIITYEASAKLTETTKESTRGLHTNAFSGTSGQLTITSHTFENGVGTIEFDGDVTSIGTGAFYNCNSLTSVTIPDSVTSIGNSAFMYCTHLTSVTIPDSVTSIDGFAFSTCTGLTSITIPDGVTSIGSDAFNWCSGLTSITSLAMTAPAIKSSTFVSIKTNGILYVPTGSTGYDVWMGTGDDYLGKYNWTKVEQ